MPKHIFITSDAWKDFLSWVNIRVRYLDIVTICTSTRGRLIPYEWPGRSVSGLKLSHDPKIRIFE